MHAWSARGSTNVSKALARLNWTGLADGVIDGDAPTAEAVSAAVSAAGSGSGSATDAAAGTVPHRTNCRLGCDAPLGPRSPPWTCATQPPDSSSAPPRA